MLWPCSGPKSRVRRINMSSVPWRRSTRVCLPALFSLDITPPVDFRPEYPAAQVECQWEMGRISMGEANFSTHACARRLIHWKFSSIARIFRPRTLRLQRFEGGRYKAIVTSRALNEGVDVPEASVAIILGGSGSAREHTQRLGRILRQRANKLAVLYEITAGGTMETGVSRRRRQTEAYAGRARKISHL